MYRVTYEQLLEIPEKGGLSKRISRSTFQESAVSTPNRNSLHHATRKYRIHGQTQHGTRLSYSRVHIKKSKDYSWIGYGAPPGGKESDEWLRCLR